MTPTPAMRTRTGRVGSRCAVAVVVMALALGGCASGGGPTPPTRDASERLVKSTRVAEISWPVGPVPNADGWLVGERLTGRVREVSADGAVARVPVATVAVRGAAGDQRGLLGLVRSRAGGLFAAWTRADDGRLVVGEIFGTDQPRLLWIGPRSAARANGGALVEAGDGSLLVGVGDLLADRTLAADRSVPNRKVLALDPAGGVDQRPRIMSVGWNNPYALAVDRAGVPWVADNAGGRARERIGRADRPAADASFLGRRGDTRAPAGLVSLGSGRFGVCGFVSRVVEEVRVVAGRARVTGAVLARPCSLGVTRAPDGGFVTLTETGIWSSPPRARE